MNVDETIEALRMDLRTCAWPDQTLEETPLVTRYSILGGEFRMVTAWALDEHNADAAIREELQYHHGLGKSFEWKAFSFDRPKDLLQRLEKARFTVEEPEAVMIYDLQDGLQPFLTEDEITVRRIEREGDLRDFRLVAEEAFGKDYTPTTNALAQAIRNGDEGHMAFVSYLDGQPASAGRLYTSPDSLFAGLYGGGTRPNFRRRSAYRAHVAARARAAARRGSRYLMVDARPTSEPILRRLGFTKVATTWPCESPDPSL